MANPKSSIDALLYALLDCELGLDGARPAAWQVDLQQVLEITGEQTEGSSLIKAQVRAAGLKRVLGPLAYEDDHAGV